MLLWFLFLILRLSQQHLQSQVIAYFVPILMFEILALILFPTRPSIESVFASHLLRTFITFYWCRKWTTWSMVISRYYCVCVVVRNMCRIWLCEVILQGLIIDCHYYWIVYGHCVYVLCDGLLFFPTFSFSFRRICLCNFLDCYADFNST